MVLRITLGFLASVILDRGENMGRKPGLEYIEMISCRQMLKRQLAI